MTILVGGPIADSSGHVHVVHLPVSDGPPETSLDVRARRAALA